MKPWYRSQTITGITGGAAIGLAQPAYRLALALLGWIVGDGDAAQGHEQIAADLATLAGGLWMAYSAWRGRVKATGPLR